MATVPQTILGRIEFFEQHLPLWAADPTSIGLTALEVSELAALVAQARADYESAQVARINARGLTEQQNTTVSAMYELGSAFIRTIRALAIKNNDPSIYVAAGIPAPQAPAPVGPPEKPTDLDATVILPFGIQLTWKGSVASGAYFGVFRKLVGETSFSLIKTTGDKSFDDVNLPAGVSGVDYYIAALRDSFQINSSSLQVRFGPEGATMTALSMAA